MLDRSVEQDFWLSDDAVDVDAEIIDAVAPGSSLRIGLFSVFTVFFNTVGNVGERETAGESVFILGAEGTESVHSESAPPEPDGGILSYDLSPTPLPARVHVTTERLLELLRGTGSVELDAVGASLFASTEERNLLRCWVMDLSGLMTPMPRPDNLFQDIITPMAVSALTDYRHSAGHLALLHSVYAITAFWRANIQPSGAYASDLGSQHVKKSLRHLSQSLTASDFEQQLAILAAISVLLVIPAFSAENPNWRVHLHGGIAWLQAVDKSGWSHSGSATALYQIFLFYDALNPILHPGVGSPRMQSYSLHHIGSGPNEAGDDDDQGRHVEAEVEVEMEWYLGGTLGLTRPLLTIIRQINGWIFARVTPSAEALDRLELQLYRTDPSHEHFGCPTEQCEHLARLHACIYYYACHVYFASSLRQISARKVQHLVRRGVEQLEATAILEIGYNVSNILWPVFILACEADEADLRLRVMKCLDRRISLGTTNNEAAKEVISTVWRQRDKAADGVVIRWFDVMNEMDLDLLLL